MATVSRWTRGGGLAMLQQISFEGFSDWSGQAIDKQSFVIYVCSLNKGWHEISLSKTAEKEFDVHYVLDTDGIFHYFGQAAELLLRIFSDGDADPEGLDITMDWVTFFTRQNFVMFDAESNAHRTSIETSSFVTMPRDWKSL